ncbi:MAG: acyl carrier protein [Myxococcales bacterium]|nr:acyl carrier protein [Myxococcales bacterium]MBL8718376.1 acyl carrier protein [Myxococcales bacterium]
METFERIRALAADVFGVPPSTLGPASSPDDVPGWDSLQHLTLVAIIEQELDVRLRDADAADAQTLGELTQAVVRARAEAA